jgi:hypothetical protein
LWNPTLRNPRRVRHPAIESTSAAARWLSVTDVTRRGAVPKGTRVFPPFPGTTVPGFHISCLRHLFSMALRRPKPGKCPGSNSPTLRPCSGQASLGVDAQPRGIVLGRAALWTSLLPWNRMLRFQFAPRGRLMEWFRWWREPKVKSPRDLRLWNPTFRTPRRVCTRRHPAKPRELEVR